MATPRSAWSMVTPMLLFSSFCLLVGDMLFGYDTGSYGGILANPGFVRQFGSYNANTKAYVFTSLQTSLMSSLAFIGKFIGCFTAGPLIEKFGHRVVFWILSAVSVIGVIIEITSADSTPLSGRFAQFIVGRIVVYISIGLVEVCVTTYQSEIVPAAFRGLVVVSLQLFLNAGSLMASGVNKGFSTDTSPVGWKAVTGVQFVFPVLITCFTFFIPNSPRWLLSKDREDDALDSLRKIRPQSDRDSGMCENEIQYIRTALQEDVHKGSWLDMIRGTNLRRTTIVMVFYFFQQVTGQAFVSTYQTTFYKENGFADQAFTYPIITGALGMFAVIPGMWLVDSLGRRYTLLVSFFLQSVFMFLLAGIGQKAGKTTVENNAVVAAFMMFAVCYNFGGASIPYLLGSEIPHASVREKTQAIGAAWNVIWAFVTNFIIPYMIAGIHFQVGWVFGGISLLALIYTFFFLPETKGRTLEDIDELFQSRYNPFKKAPVVRRPDTFVIDPSGAEKGATASLHSRISH